MTIIAAQIFGLPKLLAGDGGSVSVTDGVSPYDSTVGIRFLTDGRVQIGSAINGGAVSWSDHGSWIKPEALASGDYSVRYTNRSGTPDFTSKAAAEDSWVAITTTRTWTWNETTAGSPSFTCDFEVRADASAAKTGSEGYTFQVNNI